MIGKKVLRYKILKQIGIGGYGEIYQAFDTKLKRIVAVKFIRADRLRDPLDLERFASEARLAADLDHPNICAVFDYDYFEKSPFIVMQYVQGLTIRQAVNNRPLKINTKGNSPNDVSFIDRQERIYLVDCFRRLRCPKYILKSG